MIQKKSFGDRVFDLVNGLLLTAVAVCTLYPMLYVVFASFSEPYLFKAHDFLLLWKPLGFQLGTYRLLFRNASLVRSFGNTLFYTAAGTAISMFVTLLGAYALSRRGYTFRRGITLLIMFTMYFGGGLVPTYLWVSQLKLIDTVWAILLPNMLSTYNLIVMRTAFEAVPASLEESARIDGANDFVILFRIMLPLCLPTFAVVAMFYGVGRWNEWFNAVIYLNRRALFPMQLILREILITASDSYVADQGGDPGSMEATRELLKYAAIVVTTLPILCVYPFIQKYFVKGMMLGAVKG